MARNHSHKHNMPIINKPTPVVIDKQPKVVIINDNDNKSKMKDWPKNPSTLVSYIELIDPLKKILTTAYRLYRKEDIKEFKYEGYNIGKQELTAFPSPEIRFQKNSIEYEDKRFGRKIIDIVLNISFLLGMEQGRRIANNDYNSSSATTKDLEKTLAKYREANKELRYKIDLLEVGNEIIAKTPNLSEKKYKSLLLEGIKKRQKDRIKHAKKELAIDKSKSSFSIKPLPTTDFKIMKDLASSIYRGGNDAPEHRDCSLEAWKVILKNHGWTFVDWQDKCKKDKFEIFVG
jgi:hypothetical protein